MGESSPIFYFRLLCSERRHCTVFQFLQLFLPRHDKILLLKVLLGVLFNLSHIDDLIRLSSCHLPDIFDLLFWFPRLYPE